MSSDFQRARPFTGTAADLTFEKPKSSLNQFLSNICRNQTSINIDQITTKRKGITQIYEDNHKNKQNNDESKQNQEKNILNNRARSAHNSRERDCKRCTLNTQLCISPNKQKNNSHHRKNSFQQIYQYNKSSRGKTHEQKLDYQNNYFASTQANRNNCRKFFDNISAMSSLMSQDTKDEKLENNQQDQQIDDQNQKLNNNQDFSKMKIDGNMIIPRKSKVLFSRKKITGSKTFEINNDEPENEEYSLTFISSYSSSKKDNLKTSNHQNMKNKIKQEQHKQTIHQVEGNQSKELAQLLFEEQQAIIYSKIVPLTFKVLSSPEKIQTPRPYSNEKLSVKLNQHLSSDFQAAYLQKFSLQNRERKNQNVISSKDIEREEQNKDITTKQIFIDNKINNINYKFELIHFQNFRPNTPLRPQTSQRQSKMEIFSRKTGFQGSKLTSFIF